MAAFSVAPAPVLIHCLRLAGTTRRAGVSVALVAERIVHWSIQRADRTTHLRIVLIAVIAAAGVIIAAKSAQWDRTPGAQTSGEQSYTVSD